jgi:ribose-phosphate pyrophosphokinase
MFDDMIATGGTIQEAADTLKKHGAGKIYVTATHGVFAGKAVERLTKAPIERLIITDTIPVCPRLDPLKDRLTVLSVAPLIGEAIKRIHLNQSVSDVLRGASGGKR